MGNTHPEGLSFEPTGPGWTPTREPIPQSHDRVRLLTDRNLRSLKVNHPDEWDGAMTEVMTLMPPPKRNRRTGVLENGMSTDEQERLVALSLLISHGVVSEVLHGHTAAPDPHHVEGSA